MIQWYPISWDHESQVPVARCWFRRAVCGTDHEEWTSFDREVNGNQELGGSVVKIRKLGYSGPTFSAESWARLFVDGRLAFTVVAVAVVIVLWSWYCWQWRVVTTSTTGNETETAMAFPNPETLSTWIKRGPCFQRQASWTNMFYILYFKSTMCPKHYTCPLKPSSPGCGLKFSTWLRPGNTALLRRVYQSLKMEPGK